MHREIHRKYIGSVSHPTGQISYHYTVFVLNHTQGCGSGPGSGLNFGFTIFIYKLVIMLVSSSFIKSAEGTIHSQVVIHPITPYLIQSMKQRASVKAIGLEALKIRCMKIRGCFKKKLCPLIY